MGVLVGYRAVIDRAPVSFTDDTAVFANVPAFVHVNGYDEEEEVQREIVRFLPGAIIRFEHYGANGSVVDAWAMDIPSSLIGRTSDYLRTVFPQWSVEGYDSAGATLRRIAPSAPTQVYLVSSTPEGFIVVFFDDEIGGTRLKEVTNISTVGLPEIEVQRLNAGVLVRGEERLMRFLEDFGS
jgi:hypothetical protein